MQRNKSSTKKTKSSNRSQSTSKKLSTNTKKKESLKPKWVKAFVGPFTKKLAIKLVNDLRMLGHHTYSRKRNKNGWDVFIDINYPLPNKTLVE